MTIYIAGRDDREFSTIMSQLYFQTKRYLWETSKPRFYGGLSLALWVIFSVFNLGMVIGLFLKFLRPRYRLDFLDSFPFEGE